MSTVDGFPPISDYAFISDCHSLALVARGDYRSDLLDMLQGVADADPHLIEEEWVQAAVEDMHALTDGGRVPLVHNYGRALIDPVPLEPTGQASRFLSLQWLRVRRAFSGALDTSSAPSRSRWEVGLFSVA